MTHYTVELGEPGDPTKCYVGKDLKTYHTTENCKRLTLIEAWMVRKKFLAAAKKHGRPITAKVIELPDNDDD